MDFIQATYLIHTCCPLDKAVSALGGEQTYGTFVELPSVTDDIRERHGASVEHAVEQDSFTASEEYCHLSGGRAKPGDTITAAEVTVRYPLLNIGRSLPNLMTAVGGNLYELKELTGLRLEDIDVPESFLKPFPGPKHGIAGTRKLTGVEGRPIIGTIIKPSVGLSPEDTATLVKELIEAGLDFIKDDELISNPEYSPLEERVSAVMRVINDHADRTGKKAMYAFNITDEPDAMKRHQTMVAEKGGDCVMVSMISAGLATVAQLRRECPLAIHGHRNGWGAMSKCPILGWSYVAFQKLWRIAGVDHLHVNAIDNKFCENNESVIRSARACLEPIHGGYCVMPVFSSGQWAGHAAKTYRALDSVDLMHLAGGGILAHPSGPTAGVASFHRAWEAAAKDIPLHEHAKSNRELSEAIEKFEK